MASNDTSGTSGYWDYYRWKGTGTDSKSAITPYNWGHLLDSLTSASPTQMRWVQRKILVACPDKWDKEVSLKFVELVNYKTKTGWKVTLLISGDVLITDPNVEKRTMSEFVPLLKDGAIGDELILINKFFEENPCE